MAQGRVIVLTSIVLAGVTTKYVEAPLRGSRALERGYALPALSVAVAVALVAAPAASWKAGIDREARSIAEAEGPQFPGAQAVFGAPVPQGGKLAPALTSLGDQWPAFADCRGDEGMDTHYCSNGKEGQSRTVLVLGSSHPFMWSTPLLNLAQERNWRIETATRGFCPLTQGADRDPNMPLDCAQWQDTQATAAIERRPDLVVTTSTRSGYLDAPGEYLDPGWPPIVGRIADAGIPVLAIRDTPRNIDPASGPDCVAQHLDDRSFCKLNRYAAYAPEDPTLAVRSELPGVSFLDFSDVFCPGGTCPSVIGNVVVYKDGNHLTRAFLNTLTPLFAERFFPAVGWDA